jgi:hypothetical protein
VKFDLRERMRLAGFDPARPEAEAEYHKWRDRKRKELSRAKIRGNPRKSADTVIEIIAEIPQSADIVAAPIINTTERGTKDSHSKKRRDSGRSLRASARATQLVLWETSSPPVPAALEKVSFPADFVLTPRLVEMAAQMAGWNFGRANLEFHKFNAYYRREGRQFADWDAAWMSWCLNGVERDVRREVGELVPKGSLEDRTRKAATVFDEMRAELRMKGQG